MMAGKICFCLFACLAGALAASRGPTGPTNGGSSTSAELWEPSNGVSRETFMKYAGQTEDDYKQVLDDVTRIQRHAANKYGRQVADDEITAFYDDVMLVPEQSAFILQKFLYRKKRKIYNFDNFPVYKWDKVGQTPVVYYKFDGSHSAEDQLKVEDAMRHWEERTCIRFQRLGLNEPFSGNHVLITNEVSGCWSYIGRIANLIPQPLNLQSQSCLFRPGTAVHELGHAIGFFHEHVRPDRDEYIYIMTQNLPASRLGSFESELDTLVDTYNVPYDYASVMHYGAQAWSTSRSAGLLTIVPRDPLYRFSMGQRIGLSYFDVQIANIAYCDDVCPPLTCANGGHVNPNNCEVCTCVDGYGGRLCDAVDSSSPECPLALDNSDGDGTIFVTSANEQCVTSPGYDQGRSYSDGVSCNWKFQAPDGCNIDVYFKDDFAVYCSGSSSFEPICYHWVEIKYKNGLTGRGPRFCCYGQPSLGQTGVLTSEGKEVMVTFRTDYDRDSTYRGFKLCYKLNNDQCLTTASTPTTLSTTPSTTTSSTTETTTTSTTETTSPSTTETTTSSTTETTTSSTTETTTSSTTETTSPSTTETTTSSTTSTTSPTTTETTTSSTTETSTTSTTPRSTTTTSTTSTTSRGDSNESGGSSQSDSESNESDESNESEESWGWGRKRIPRRRARRNRWWWW